MKDIDGLKALLCMVAKACLGFILAVSLIVLTAGTTVKIAISIVKLLGL